MASIAVAVTGIGAVNSLGANTRIFWERLIQGASGIAEISSFDSGPWRTHIASEIKGLTNSAAYPDRVYQLASLACKEALEQSGLDPARALTGVVLGTLHGGLRTLEDLVWRQVSEGRQVDVRPGFPGYPAAGLSRFVAHRCSCVGPVMTSVIACAASGAAISRALDWIRMGRAEAVITGGADAFCPTTFSGFNAMRSAALNACRPFSLGREGLVIGEGAGILILESLDHAKARGAKVLALLCGAGLAEDAHHITAPDPNGLGAARAMRQALADAGLEPDQIDYINAHGTGTPANDAMETMAIKRVFGSAAKQIPVSSIKAAVGHCMGAAGAVEAVAAVMTLMHQLLPPTLNFVPGDPQCDLDYVPDQARTRQVGSVLSNSFGFAGNNACLVFCQPPGFEAKV
jgi:3-oxoacyl-[acyl-carrier-protein] synthase II